MLKRLLRPTAFKLALVIGLLFGGVHFLRTAAGLKLRYLDLLEAKALDLKFQFRGARPLSHKVLLAEVDEKAIDAQGLWPWNRAVVGQAIQKLLDAGAFSVGLDFVVSDTDRNLGMATVAEMKRLLPPPSGEGDPLAAVHGRLDALLEQTPDRALAAVIAEQKDALVLGLLPLEAEAARQLPEGRVRQYASQLDRSRTAGLSQLDLASQKVKPEDASNLPPLDVPEVVAVQGWLQEIAGEAAHFGSFEAGADSDGTLRRYVPLFRHGDGFIPALAPATVAAGLQTQLFPYRFGSSQRLGGVAYFTDDRGLVTMPVDPFDHGRMLIDWPGPVAAWARAGDGCAGKACDRISLADILSGQFDPEVVKDKVVFIGVTALGTFDQRVTPFDGFVPGVYLHLAVAESMLSGHHFDVSAGVHFAEALVLVLIGLIGALLLPRLPIWGQVSVPLLGSALWLGVVHWLFARGQHLFTVIPLMEWTVLAFAVITFRYLVADQEKRQVRQAFQHYLTESVMEEMLANPDKLRLGGQKREMTVFFSDIRGFTTLSEMLPPDEVSKLLNEYLTPMTDLVFENVGTLDKYMGDAIMAFWGAPSEQPDHAMRACRTAVEMLEKLDLMRKDWKARGLPDIDIGIGLNTGFISVGNMGSTRLFNYTVIGDDVNLASRLEGTNKNYGTRIILGENTWVKVKGQVVGRELGGVQVKGKKKPVTIFELRRMGTPTPEEQETISAFEGALAAYRGRRWDEAQTGFEKVQRAWPGDGPCEKYLDDISDKRSHPPDDSWDGTYVMKTK